MKYIKLTSSVKPGLSFKGFSVTQMRKIQLENGYTRIANELIEKLVCARLTGGELAMCLFVIRKTYGFGKKLDLISLSQLEEGLHLSHWYVSKLKKTLVSRRLLIREKNRIGINKNWNEWVVSQSLLVSWRTIGLVSHSLHTKETITKEINNKNYLPAKAGKKMEPTYEEEEDNIPSKVLRKREARKAGVQDKEVIDEIRHWAEERMSHKFLNVMMQNANIVKMLKAGYTAEQIKTKWQELESDEYWSSKGINFGVVLNQMSNHKVTAKAPKTYKI